MSDSESNTLTPLGPPNALQPPRSSRGAIGIWPQLLEAVQKLSHNPLPLSEFKQAYDVDFGSASEVTSLIAGNPDYLVGSREPVDILSQFVRLVIHSFNAGDVVAMTLDALGSGPAGESSTDPNAAKDMLVGQGGLAQTADDLSKEYSAFVDRLEGITNQRKGAFDDFREAGQALLEKADALAKTPPENLAYLQSVTREAENHIALQLTKMSEASSQVAIGAVLANLVAAAKSVANGWSEAAKSFRQVIDHATDSELASADYFKSYLHIQEAVSQWTELADEGRRFTVNVFVTT